MPGLFFISYRRSDSDIWADRLAGDLRANSVGRVFMDIREIAPGMPWRTVLDTALGACTALLVVIGPDWLGAKDERGRRRLDDTSDVLRNEIAEALRRQTRIVPLLVDGARLPTASELPEDIQTLTELQAHDLTVKHWPNDVAQLIRILKELVDGDSSPEKPVSPPPPDRKPLPALWVGMALSSVAIIGVVATIAYFRNDSSAADNVQTSNTNAPSGGSVPDPLAPHAIVPFERYDYSSGYFARLADRKWVEQRYSESGRFAEFSERSRDSTYIYLVDERKRHGRDMHVRIPVGGGMSQYAWDSPRNWIDNIAVQRSR